MTISLISFKKNHAISAQNHVLKENLIDSNTQPHRYKFRLFINLNIMMTPARLIILLLVLSLIACEKNNESAAAITDHLIGSWFNPQYNDSIVTYGRSEGLVDNEYGFSFKDDKTFIERKNAGWCGTPPISYADFDGTWSKKDSIIEITVDYWGGTSDYTWKLVSVDETNLVIIRVEEEYHMENLQQ